MTIIHPARQVARVLATALVGATLWAASFVPAAAQVDPAPHIRKVVEDWLGGRHRVDEVTRTPLANMQAMLNMYPLPNSLDVSQTKGNYNLVSQETSRNPRQNNQLRFDWKPSEKDSIFFSTGVQKSYQAGSEITGDPHRLRQIIWNLLSNATKFTPDAGEITFGVG